MEAEKIQTLTDRAGAIRREAERLAAEGDAFPAMAKNARRILACVRMIEIDLGGSATDFAESERS